MNLSDWRRRREFVRRARLAAHGTLELSDAYRRVSQARKRPLWRRVAAGFLVAIVVAAFVIGPLGFLNALIVSGAYRAVGPDSVLVPISVIQSCVACAVGSAILVGLRRSRWMTIVSVLPVRDGRIAWRAWCFVAIGTATVLYPTLWALGFVAFAERLEPVGWWLALAIGLEQWLVAIAVATLLAARWPQFPMATVGLYGLLASLLFFMIYLSGGALGLPILAAVVYAVLPAGWLNAVFGRAALAGVGWDWWALVPAALVVAAGAFSLLKLLRSYRIREFRFLSGVPALADSELWTGRTASLDFRFRFLGNKLWFLTDAATECYASPTVARSADEAAAVVRSRFRSFARAHEAPKRCLNRWQARLLTARETDLLAYMTADGLTWNHRYPKYLAFHVACMALALLLPAAQPRFEYAILLPIAQLMMILQLSTRSGAWFGFSAAPFGGACVSRYALLPAGLDELARMMLKLAAFRCLLLLPELLCVMWTASVAMGLTSRWLAWCLAGGGVAFAIFMAQRSIIASRFAATMSWPTRRHDRWYWRLGRAVVSVQTVMLLMVCGGGLGLIAVVIFAIVPVGLLAFFVYSALIVLLGLASSAAWLLVRTMYRRNIVDLVRDRPSAAQRTWMALEQSQYPARVGGLTGNEALAMSGPA